MPPVQEDSARLFAALPILPFAKRELDAARALLGGAPSDELLDAAFTAEAVRHVALKNYRILHFATHVLLPAELRCQNEPAIVTSAPAHARDALGALLTAGAVTGLDLDANAVILSACNTGGPGSSTGGESLSGFARAFFFAGARSLLVTHWSISDQTSAFLVADTLRRLAAGQDGGLAGALQAAQLQPCREGLTGEPGAPILLGIVCTDRRGPQWRWRQWGPRRRLGWCPAKTQHVRR